MKAFSSVLDTIGKTPLVRLDRLTTELGLKDKTIFAKLENVNPGLSKKDRIALSIIKHAKETGKLQPGQTVVELTSGNTGTGLAIACAILKHPFIAVMSKGNSIERATMMRALGAKVELVPQAVGSIPNQVTGDDLQLVEERSIELVEHHGAYLADQFHNEGNFKAHYEGTGPEVWEQTEGKFDSFVDFVGTGGSFGGMASFFKQQNDSINCYVVEPACAPILSNRFQSSNLNILEEGIAGIPHKIQGGGYARDDLSFINEGLVNGFLTVSDEEAISTSRMLGTVEGILGGYSAGANVAAAINLIRSGKAEAVVAIICDSGLKYMSTDLYADN